MTESVSSRLLKTMSLIMISTILALSLSASVFAVGSSSSGSNEDAGNSNSSSNQHENVGNGEGGESAADKQARRQNACKAGETKMLQLQNKLTASGESFQNKVNGVMERIDAYVANKGLTSEAMTRLREQVKTKQDSAQNSVQATRQKQGNIDCNNPDGVVANMNAYRNQVQNYKAEANEYVASIKAYVQEIKAVVVAATEESAE